MRRGLWVFVMLLVFRFGPVEGQYGWCGYGLIEGLPLLANQLAPLEALTPAKSSNAHPNELFQYRYNLNHSAVIIEGCFDVLPTTEIVRSLLAQSVTVDEKSAERLAPDLAERLDPGRVLTTYDVARAYVDELLVYSLFAEGKDHEESAGQARAYLRVNQKDWEPPCVGYC